MSRAVRQSAGDVLQAHRAGLASRTAANLLDLGVVWFLGILVLVGVGAVRYVVGGVPFRPPAAPLQMSAPLGTLLLLAYLTGGWAATGRTVGKQLAGLRVVDRTGQRLSAGRALLRAALCVLFPAGLLWVLVNRRNHSLQDLLVRSAVVYDWSYRAPSGSRPRSGGSGRPGSGAEAT